MANNSYKQYIFYALCLAFIGPIYVACTKKVNPLIIHDLSYKNDSLRLVLGIDSIFDIQFDYPDSAFQEWQPYADEARAKKIYRPLMSYYRYAVFNRAILVEDIKTASNLAEKSMKIAKITNDSTFWGQANYNKAILFSAQEILDSSSYYYLRTVDYLKSGHDWGTELDAWNNLAEMTKMQGDFHTAEKYKLSVLRRTKKRKDKKELGYMYTSLSQLYIELEQLDKSQIYLDSAQQIYKFFGDTSNLYLLNAHISLALATQNYTHALNYLHLLNQKWNNGHNSLNYGKLLFRLSYVHSELNNQDSAKYYLALFEEQDATDQLPREYQMEYYEMKYALNGNNSPPVEKVNILSKINSLLSERLEQNENLFGTQKLHQMEQAEKDNIILQKTIQNQHKNLIITWLIVGLSALLGAIMFAFFFFKKRREIQQQKILLKEQQQEFELKSSLLESQLTERNRISQELHDDLGSTLTSISMSTELLKKKNPEMNSREVEIISDSSSSLVDKMNEIVWSLNSNNDSLQSLVAYIRKFASEFLTDSVLTFSIDAPTTIPTIEINGAIRRAIFLTFKEALNNIVKHAEATEVKIIFRLEKEMFSIMIEDNGKGFPENDETFILGNGLRNMKNNMLNIKGNMDYISNHGGSKIKLTYLLNIAES